MAADEATIGRVALVTGGARRIGHAIVERLASEGYSIVIHCNSAVDEAEALANELLGRGTQAVVVAADLADPDGVASLGETAGAFFGPVTLLVNNASTFIADDVTALDVAGWNRQFSVNLRAPSMLAGMMANALPATAQGAVINIIDQRVWKLTPEYYSYTLTKSALWTATRTLAQRLSPRIRVNAVGPGPTLASIHDGVGGLEAEAAGTLLGKIVPPEAIAEAVAWLANASHVTGQMIAVDSGQHLGWRTPDIVSGL
jgi:NAD(P)-dependent dehydrogenase (short-subunit alcohol dehydrogenase family)